MSDQIKHECGLAFIRLKKPISYYYRKYGSSFYAINKLYLLMEKQHNRGQDGAGIATLKLNVEPGYQFLHRLRKSGSNAIREVFDSVNDEMTELERMYPNLRKHPGLLKGYFRFMGEVMLGHLRYATKGLTSVKYCHPFIQSDINPNRNIAMAGNFGLVNNEALLDYIKDRNISNTDRESEIGPMMHIFHHFLCEEEGLHPEGANIEEVLKKSCALYEGGYVFGGLIGSGHSFIMRDPRGIRPAYYYEDDEVVIAASERPALITTFNLNPKKVNELPRGAALLVDPEGRLEVKKILEPLDKKACSFERIYFSRGNDAEIYKERIQLGLNLADQVLKVLNNDLKNTIVSFIPNTAEIAFYGLIKGLENYLKNIEADRIIRNKNNMTDAEIRELIHRKVRIEKIAIKDVKLRTFITEDNSRDDMVQHVYDITYGTVKRGEDTLVVIDDSIVRGTTLRNSILKMLDRLGPKKIVVVSSAPQIRYPDCYGIDMSKMHEFIAFNAAISLLKKQGKDAVIHETYKNCKAALANPENAPEENQVKAIYADFTPEEVSLEIAELLKSDEVDAEVEIIFQSIEGLHEACPDNTGDWYFTGDYPTPNGKHVAHQSFVDYYETKFSN